MTNLSPAKEVTINKFSRFYMWRNPKEPISCLATKQVLLHELRRTVLENLQLDAGTDRTQYWQPRSIGNSSKDDGNVNDDARKQ